MTNDVNGVTGMSHPPLVCVIGNMAHKGDFVRLRRQNESCEIIYLSTILNVTGLTVL